MKSLYIPFALLMLALPLLGGCGGGGNRSQPTTSTVNGILIASATNTPLNGVTVSLADASSTSTVTDDVGAFALANVPIGSHTLMFTEGHSVLGSQSINVAGSTTSLGNIGVLTELGQPAPPFAITSTENRTE